jgi:hypothetical protein
VGLKFIKGQEVEFNFLGMICKGIVVNPDIEDNAVKVNYNGTIHRVGLTEKDNKFCFLI